MTRQFQSAGRTEIGKVRRRNEDAILVRDDAGLWAAADGLGGHAAGDYASNLIVQRLARVTRVGGALDFIEAIETTLAEVNTDLRHAAQTRGVDLIASTVVLLVHTGDFMLFGWVGDSRAYVCENGHCIQLTRDHACGGGDGEPPAAGSGVLTRAVGAETTFSVDWVAADRRRGRTFLLCTDGLNKELDDAEIGAACRRGATPTATLDGLFATALARAARDNISAVIVCPAGDTPAVAGMDKFNQALHALDEAHHRGQMRHDDYRAQRRRLFDALPGLATSAATPATRWFARLQGWLGRR